MDISKTSHNFLHTFCIRPNFRFQTQGDDEEVILVLRAHLFTQLGWVLNSFLILFLMVLLDYFFSFFLNPIQTIFTYIFSLFFVFAYIWLNILNWFFNVGIITNERIVDIDFNAILYKEISEARLDKVQDLTEKAGGFFETFFDYGHLYIQTAGAQEQNIEYDHIPHPQIVIKIIHKLTEKP